MSNTTKKIRIMSVVGARPNFMKIAPFIHALQKQADRFESFLVHTGQHYDAAMSQSFFESLDIPEPDVDLGIGFGSHALMGFAIQSFGNTDNSCTFRN